MTSISELSKTKRKIIAAGAEIPDDWLVDKDMMISPLSFVDIDTVRNLWWNKHKYFLTEMNKDCKDGDGSIISDDMLEMQVSLRDDFRACALIAEALKNKGISSIHIVDADEKQCLFDMLRYEGYSKEQIRRCLWM